jgi:hypothetical protein
MRTIGDRFDRFPTLGTTFSYSVPETQQANGIAERMNRTLKEKAQSDIAACGLDWKYWPLAVKHANYLRNRSPAAGIDTVGRSRSTVISGSERPKF